MTFYGVEGLVIEDWTLYPWECEALAWSRIPTLRGLGALEHVARRYGRRIILQPASIKEAAEALGAAELFLSPLHENRHANDAIRHGVYYLNQKGAS